MKNKIQLFAFLFCSITILFYAAESFGQMPPEKGVIMEISSPAFRHNQTIPSKFTCEGEDKNPQLLISDVPADAKSLALIVDDPDAPGKTWVHWVVFNIPADTQEIPENSVLGKQGTNDFNRLNYGGPCPPSGEHRYFFKLYALDTVLILPEGIGKKKLEEGMKGHILTKAELVGLYQKASQ